MAESDSQNKASNAGGGITGALGGLTKTLGGTASAALSGTGSIVNTVTHETANVGDSLIGKDNIASNIVRSTGQVAKGATDGAANGVSNATGGEKPREL